MELAMFADKKPNFARLQARGFAREGADWRLRTLIADGQFAMTVTVTAAGEVQTCLVDCECGVEYVLHRVEGAEGSFVGAVRAGHDAVLEQIAAECFEPAAFAAPAARELIAYARAKYSEEPEFLWPKFTNNAVLRRADTGKWYALLVRLPLSRLGLGGDAPADIVDLRFEPEELARLLAAGECLPGYHMNKKHWGTLLLDGYVPMAEVCRRLDESRLLAVK